LALVDHVAFELFGFQVYWYGILAAAGFVLGFGSAARRAPRVGLNSEHVFNLAPWIILGAVFGARLLYVISYWNQEFAGKPFYHIFNMRSGLVFYGGLIGSCLGTIIYCLRHKLRIWMVGDVFAPSVALGHGIGRIGCFMTGCCYGRECSLPWAVHFPKDHWTHGAGVHPTQLYEAGLNLLFYGFLAWYFKRRRFEGEVFAIYLVGYAIIRAIVEVFRGDYSRHFVANMLTPGQLVSIFIFAAGMTLWMSKNSRHLKAARPNPA
jgi:phosphatidylglycerol---prolipoprotein diacylglyceryl transferase